MKNKGFMLIEVIAAVAVVAVCLTMIVQALLANVKAGTLFQERARALFAMENQLGMVYAFSGAPDTLPAQKDLPSPYNQLRLAASTTEVEEHLSRAGLTIQGLRGHAGFHVSTLIFKPEQTQSGSFTR